MTDNGNGTLTIACGGTEAVVTGQVTGTPSISVANPGAVVEGGSIDFTLSLSAATTQTVTVDYATIDGSATAPADYQSTSGTASITEGQISTTVSVPTVDDNVTEGPESFALTLSAPHYATIGHGTATAVIQDNDCADTEPDTLATATNRGSISGDTGSGVLSANGSVCAGDQDWFTFTLTEDDSSFLSSPPLTANITLSMSSGAGDLDLYVYNATGGLVMSSMTSGTATENVPLHVTDTFSDDTAQYFIKVVGDPATAVNNYTLSIRGNTR